MTALRRRRTSRLSPPALLAALYAGLIVAGALVLKLPVAAHGPTSWGDALFTATSAVTVTGLVTLDPGSHFTPFGQAALLLLMQCGGIGLMTFGVLVLGALGLPIRLSQQLVLREDLQRTSLDDLGGLARAILGFALAAEAVGALALLAAFVPELGWARGAWAAVFHAVSAFNNAGFALWPDGLSRWVASPVVNLVVPGLFILGGLGFGVVLDLARARRWRPLSLHSKLTLAATAALLVWAPVMVALMEWRNPLTLGALPDWTARLQAAWFMGTTPRTAGFNTIDIAGLRDSTALMTISLMLIGGGSASTAGGIKVTTALALCLFTLAFFSRRETMHAYGRSLGPREAVKVLAVTALSIFVVMVGTFLLTLTTEARFLDLAFEAASAFGTVGLSRGATAELDAPGRAAIMAMMFVGRVGPLTLGFILATRSPARVRYPPGQVYLG